MEMRTYHEPDVAQAGDQKLTFAYDYMGRRVKKEVYGWDSQTSSFKHQASHTFLYDGWSLIREKREIHASSLILHTSYCWGLDLSLTTQGVGGVGGLLSVVEAEADLSTNAYYATADANGNITDYVTETGSVAARFAYDAFGRVISESIAQGLEPTAFTHRFSSKYQDVETGLNYYGFRYYDPEMGRWLNRDPIGERGGLNVLMFTLNNGVNYFDFLGLDDQCPCTPEQELAAERAKVTCLKGAAEGYETAVQGCNAERDDAELAAKFSAGVIGVAAGILGAGPWGGGAVAWGVDSLYGRLIDRRVNKCMARAKKNYDREVSSCDKISCHDE
jgi:RHS repeat-associated protein